MPILDELRSWSADQLAQLLTLRPDLLTSKDLEGLARTMTTRQSTQAAIEDLARGPRQVLEAVTVLPARSSVTDLAALAVQSPDPEELAGALEELWGRGLLRPGSVHPVGAVRELLPRPLGLGRRTAACHEYTPFFELQEMAARFGLPRPRSREAARALLQELVSDTEALAASLVALPPELLARLRQADQDGPVLRAPGADPFRGQLPEDRELAELVLIGVLCVVGVGRVEVPYEVGLAVRHPGVLRWDLGRAAVEGTAVAPDQVAATCGAAVQRLFTVVDGIVARVDNRPLPLLATGGVGVKEIRAVAADLADPAWCATVLTLLEHLGLLDRSRKDLRTTKAWPGWSAQDDATRWSELVRAWLGLHDVPPVRPASERRLKAVLLFAGFDSRAARERRRLVHLLGTAPSKASYGEKGWLALWQTRHPSGLLQVTDPAGLVPEDELRADVLHEAELLGLVADGAATPLAHAVHLGEELGATLTALAGAGQTRVRAQADMTLICTGVPSREMRQALGRVAAVEQSGAATVWRVSEQSLAGAFDDGDTPEDVEAVLLGYAGEIPQSMSYLVKDSARRHGRVRVGAATSYVLVDDDASLRDALMGKGSKELTALSVRRIAAGVAVSRGSVAATVEALRAAGVPAVAENLPGTKPATAKPRRATPARRRELPPLPSVDQPVKAAALAALLAR